MLSRCQSHSKNRPYRDLSRSARQSARTLIYIITDLTKFFKPFRKKNNIFFARVALFLLVINFYDNFPQKIAQFVDRKYKTVI